ncbi:MAG: DNA-directed RNA polymerase subunit B [Nitrososphaeria archaeon]
MKPVFERRWSMIENMLKSEGIARQHLNSYNEFLRRGIQSIIDEIGEVDVETNFGNYKIKLGKIEVGRPRVTEHDGSENYIQPREARLRNLTYAAPLYLNMQIIDSDPSINRPFKSYIGNLPVMVKSDICVLHGLSEQELIDVGEDPNDPGGYFIINGSERIIIGLEDMSPNKILVSREKPGSAITFRSVVHSSIVGFRSKVDMFMKNDNAIYVRIPVMPTEIPYVVLMRALGVTKDADIAQAVSSMEEIQDEMVPSLEKSEGVLSQPDAIMYIGNRIAHGQVDEIRIKRAEQLIDAYLLPHLGREPAKRFDKAMFLSEMASKLIQLKLGYVHQDDRDHYGNKVIKFAGEQLADIFRTSMRNLTRDMKYQLDRAGQKKGPSVVQAVIRPGIITDKVTNAIATGNWGRGRVGITQLLDRTNRLSTISHLRRIQSPLSRTQPNFEARELHGTQFGRICPTETPEGSNCGLVKNLALSAVISVSHDFSSIKEKIEKVMTEKGYKVFFEGRLIGYTEDADSAAKKLKDMRRKGELPFDVSISVYYPTDSRGEKRLMVSANSGRVMRPLAIVQDGKPKLTDEHVERIERGEINWRDLLLDGVVELIDADEEENCLVAIDEYHISAETTHMEIYPPAMLGAVASIIPFPEYNQSPRNTYESAMAKQALGFSIANINEALYVRQHMLEYPQKPMVTTKSVKLLNMDSAPTGFNAVVAVLSFEGYNIEDAIVMNRASIERGIGRSYFYRLYEAEAQQYLGGLKDKFEIPSPDSNVRGYKGEKYYRNLESDGVAYANADLKGGDVVIARLSPPRFSEEYKGIEAHGLYLRDTSVTMRPSESGTVDSVVLTQSVEGNRLYKVRVRDHRVPELGDKFASRHGQKGVVGMIVRPEDMPYTEDGVIPDIIINPHAFPSRMTVGQFLESIAGKAASLRGKEVDASPFEGEDVNSLQETLKKYGFSPTGKEVMYDGVTGRKLVAQVYVGVVYYQKLHHMVADKLHARARGQVQMLTRQPTEGRSRGGGLRFGEMERDCLVAYGASMVLKDRLLEESDKTTVYICSKCGLLAHYNAKTKKLECPQDGSDVKIVPVNVAYAFKLLLQEIMSLGIAPRVVIKEEV